MMQDLVVAGCPYCGERLELLIDPSGGSQEYTEDCQVCCQPMVVRVTYSQTETDTEVETETVSVELLQEDDAF
ncbi:CPXCG motif-containing cysteine-rich protein [Hydrocarboniclastica marina]|tara:strand:- start:4698 stop:4916 length:219 start_codon:yes stop_codon:yes gene_type:complete